MSTARAADNIPGGQRRSFLSTENFVDYFYSYTNTGIAKVPNWQLVPVTSDETRCPVGRVLRENGRKLYPGPNPNITKYYVGVFDAKTFLNGFIDPNAKVFTEYNNDKPIYVDDACSDDGSDDCSVLGDLGEPVYTNGNVVVNANGHNYISIQDTLPGDVRSNAAYLTIGNDFAPLVGVEGTTVEYEPYIMTTQQAYLGTNPYCSYLDLEYNNSTIVALCATTLDGGPGGPFGPSAGVFVNSSYNPAYVSVQNDISGSNAAYLGMTQSPWEPYFGIVATSTTTTEAYFGGNATETYLQLQDPVAITTVYLTSGDGTLSYPPAVYTTGVLNPVNTCGQVKLNGSGGAFTFDNPYASVAGALIFLTRVGGAAHAGVPFYSIGGPGNSTITIQSTDNQDDGYINYMIVSNHTFG